MWCGNLESGVTAQVSSSSLDRGSELGGSSPIALVLLYSTFWEVSDCASLLDNLFCPWIVFIVPRFLHSQKDLRFAANDSPSLLIGHAKFASKVLLQCADTFEVQLFVNNFPHIAVTKISIIQDLDGCTTFGLRNSIIGEHRVSE
ncbi:hypothetical protein TNCV_1533151 [Trichonephila clavipes]|nr:hypothetical protein TNCV_1533151 [Trichonephila clavipes]